jgi:TonB family protein
MPAWPRGFREKGNKAPRISASRPLLRGMPVNTTNMFSSLEPVGSVGYRRGMSFVCGVTAQALVIVIAILIGLLFPHDLQFSSKHTELIWLPNLTPPAPLPAIKIPRELPRMALPKVQPPPLPPPKIAIAAPEYVPPKIQHVEPPKVHELPAPVAAAPAPAPKVKEQIVVRTGVFGGAAEPVTTKRPVEQVQTGGFGSPEGVPSHAQKEATANTPVLGAFGLPSGPGVGNGTNGNRGVQGVVVSVGFSSGIASVANGRGNGTGKVVASAGFGSGAAGVGSGHGPSGPVTMGGFSKAQPVATTVKVAKAEGPADFQPIEILSKPAPIYTDEARQLGIQGDVAVSVVFMANGSIRINGVVKSLGHGLDQEAEQVASQIRFKPALHMGQPQDFPATVRIEFRLAGQAS